jgi:hypothetical protein
MPQETSPEDLGGDAGGGVFGDLFGGDGDDGDLF